MRDRKLFDRDRAEELTVRITDLKGQSEEERIENLIETCVDEGFEITDGAWQVFKMYFCHKPRTFLRLLIRYQEPVRDAAE